MPKKYTKNITGFRNLSHSAATIRLYIICIIHCVLLGYQKKNFSIINLSFKLVIFKKKKLLFN